MRIAETLARGVPYVGTVSGNSMRPLIRPAIDTVVIEPVDCGDVGLFDVALADLGGSYVLHRIVAERGDTFTLLGDNCAAPEREVPRGRVLGKMTGLWRRDRSVDLEGHGYACYTALWRMTAPFRRVILRAFWCMRGGLQDRCSDAKSKKGGC